MVIRGGSTFRRNGRSPGHRLGLSYLSDVGKHILFDLNIPQTNPNSILSADFACIGITAGRHSTQRETQRQAVSRNHHRNKMPNARKTRR
jgi:hypothetical protein